MTWWEGLLLLAGGLAAGVINTMAGGGSALTVPLLVLAGVPGNQANGSNRVGILAASAAAVLSFRRTGATSIAGTRSVLLPTVIGSVIGSFTISQIADDTFETIFGLLMIPIVILTVVKPKVRTDVRAVADVGDGAGIHPHRALWRRLPSRGRSGAARGADTGGLRPRHREQHQGVHQPVVTSIALPVFISQGDVVWAPALVLAVGYTGGGWFGAKLAVHGGERLVRIFMIGASLFLAGKLLGLWG